MAGYARDRIGVRWTRWSLEMLNARLNKLPYKRCEKCGEAITG